MVNLLFFLILYSPARSEYLQLRDSIERQRAEILFRHREVIRLEQISEQLKTSDEDRRELFTSRFVRREIAFSSTPNELEHLANAAGVRKSVVNYSMAEVPQYGLHSLKIKMPVAGTYANISTFIKSLETSETFFIIDSIDVRNAADSASGGAGRIALSLSLETFLYQ
jgi:Tfp pilus assembly protein PilO